jgi:small subunit ribosomal protein S3
VSIVKRIIKNNIEFVKVDELLGQEYEQAGYGGIQLTKTPLGAQINLFAMRPGRVIGKRGRAIKAASERLENELGLPNPQITVIEVEVPELNPQIMAARVANALERGVHFRRAIFWSLRRIMDSGALGCEIILKGPLRSARSRFEKVVEGYVPKSGEPALRNVKISTLHVKMKRGTLGVTVKIVPPDAKFPDKVSLEGLPDIEYQLPMEEPAPVAEAAEPIVEETIKAVELEAEAAEPVIKDEAVTEKAPFQEETLVEGAAVEPAVEEPVVEGSTLAEPALDEPTVEEAPEAVEEAVVEEPVIEEPEASVPEEAVAEESAVEKTIEAAEPVVTDEIVEEEASIQEETPVEELTVEPVVEESPIEEAVEAPEAVEEPEAEPVITESAPEVIEPEAASEEPAVEPELVSEPQPDTEPEVEIVETEPEVKPKPEADKAEETTEDQPEEEKQ